MSSPILTTHAQPHHPVAIRSERARVVAKWFGIDVNAQPNAPLAPQDEFYRSLVPAAGQLVLINGPSGAGKSSLLRCVQAAAPQANWIDLAAFPLPDAPAVDCFGDDVSLPDALKLLCRAGLGEAWSYLRTPDELSDGQRWRLRLAVAIQRAKRDSTGGQRTVLVCDEFAAVLDRITACIVGRMLRRAIGRDATFGAIVATSHDDLVVALRPHILVSCDFSSVEVRRISEAGFARSRSPRGSRTRPPAR